MPKISLWHIIYAGNQFLAQKNIFWTFCQILEDYRDRDDANFCIFAHFKGLSKMLEIQARHARKCDKVMVPTLRGIKVSHKLLLITNES